MKYAFILIAAMLILPAAIGALASEEKTFKGKKTPIIFLASATPMSAYAYPEGYGHIDVMIDLQNNKNGVIATIHEEGQQVSFAVSEKGIIVFPSPTFSEGTHTVTVSVIDKPTPICGEVSIQCENGELTFTV